MIKQGVYDFDIYRGDSSVYRMIFKNIDNSTGVESPLDLSKFNIIAQVRYTADQDSVWINLDPQVVDAAGGVLQIWLTSGVTAASVPPSDPMAPTAGVWDLQFQLITDEQNVFTPIVGTFRVRKDVTRKM